MNNYDWAGLTLADASLPVSLITLSNFTRWMAAENPPSGWWHKLNPLNVADFVTDSQSFPTLQAAASATAKVILQTNMSAIADAFRNQVDLAAFSEACSVAPWSTGGYHGHPDYIASIPLPGAYEAPGPPAPSPLPGPLPPKVPTPEEIAMNGFVNAAGQTSVAAASPSGDLLIFTLVGANWEVTDVTDQIKVQFPNAGPYTVAT